MLLVIMLPGALLLNNLVLKLGLTIFMSYLKLIIFKIVYIINVFLLQIRSPGLVLKGSYCLFVTIKANAASILCKECTLKYVLINVDESSNQLVIDNCNIENTSISITGTGNTVKIESGVILRSGELIVRGENCAVSIGKGSTFGGIRIVAVGNGSAIEIGENCLFSDKVEVWSSDTHPIYDEHNNVINHEGKITVLDRVWVGSRVTILKNVTIGSDSVVGMSSVVTKDVPKSSVVAGNPCRVVRQGITWGLEYPDKG